MEEKRKYQRFDLRLSGKILAADSKNGEGFDGVTNDVCAGGASFHTTKPFLAIGAQVKLTLTVSSDKLQELTGAQGLIKAAGAVVRSSTEGLAICFSGEPELVPIVVS